MGCLEGVAWRRAGHFRRARILVAMALAATGCVRSPPAADVVLLDGLVYTADAEQTTVAAIAIRDGRILAVGSSPEIRALAGPDTIVIDLAGRMVLPGLHDMHLHPLGIVPPAVCDLQNEPLDLDELSLRVATCLEEFPVSSGSWLMVLEWNAGGLRQGRKFQTLRAALDAVSTEQLIYLHASGGHHGAVNSPGLARARNASGELVGYDAATIERDFADLRPLIAVDEAGEPSGMLSEGARAPIGRPRLYGDVLGMDDIAKMLPAIVETLAAAGITTAMEARTSPELLAVLGDFAARGGLRVRLRTALYIDPQATEDGSALEALPAIMERFTALRRRYASEHLRVDAVKIFADGVLDGSPTSMPPQPPNAAVLSPYLRPLFVQAPSGALKVSGYQATDRQSRGVLRHTPELLRAFVREATVAGFHVHIHAIGDRAVRASVDAFAAVHPIARGAGLSQSLAHVELAHPDDQRRIGELGIAVVFTFAWAMPDTDRDLAVIPFIDRVQPGGSLYEPAHYYFRNAYPAASIQRHGGVLVAGSDAPVADRHPRPFTNIAAAVFREGPGGVLNADQRISIHDAIAAYTINGARMMGHADQLGSLEQGKLADLVVIDRDIVALAGEGKREAVASARVVWTMVGGKVIFDATAPASADSDQ